MLKTLAISLVLMAVAISSAQARRHHQDGPRGTVFDRHTVSGGWGTPSLDGREVKRVHKTRTAGLKQMRKRWHRQRGEGKSRHRSARVSREATLLPHPSGCPSRQFCGCGAALDVFGRHVRELWLARNWFKFPKAQPAPGMVAVRRHHVFVIREVRSRGRVLAYDANSGRGRTRLHERSLAGYRVVNPRAGKMAAAG